MYPVIFTYGDHTLTSWILFAWLGGCAAYFSLSSDLRLRKISSIQINGFFVGCVLVWFLGARFGQIVTVGSGKAGLVLYGGFSALIAFGFAVWLLEWKKKLSIEEFWDCGALAMAWVFSLGRIGCTLYGCCYGTPAGKWPGYLLDESHWDHQRMRFPKSLSGVSLHPATLYESIALFSIILLTYQLRELEKNKPGRFPPGVPGWICWWGYSLVRFLTEFIRLDPRGSSYLGFSPSQWFALMMMVLGAILLPFHWKRSITPIYLRRLKR